MKVDVRDLVGLRHEPGAYAPASGALDCAGCVLEVLRRAGLHEARTEFLRCVELGRPMRWSPVPDGEPLRVGDVVMQEVGSQLHVSGIVNVRPLRALTSIRGEGVRIARPAMLDGGTIYRYDGER